jgi:hypothetical protein
MGGRDGRKPHFLRGRVWLHRRALDARLAQGDLPSSSPELGYRAEQLRSTRSRRSFASGIKRIIDAAEEPRSAFTAAVPVRRREILERRTDLTDLAKLLESNETLQVRGLALLEPLLTSGDSPLFDPAPDETLEHTLRRIHAALLLR